MTPAELEDRIDRGVAVYVLGVDAATRTGVALFEVTPEPGPGLPARRRGGERRVRLVYSGESTAGGEWSLAVSVVSMVMLRGQAAGTSLIVAWEEQYLGKNPRSMATVVAARARVLYALELRAQQRMVPAHFVGVNTMSWQGKVLGKGRGKERASIKAASEATAAKIAAACDAARAPTGDAADAACIGLYELARHFTIDIAGSIRGESPAPESRPRRR